MSDTTTSTSFSQTVQPFLVHGSEGVRNYLAFARHGNAILAIKLLPPRDGKHMGSPDKTYLGGRLRSDRLTAETADAAGVTSSDVVPLADKKSFTDFREPWPAVELWEKHSASKHYASTSVGAFFAGTIKSDLDKLLAQFSDGSAYDKFTDYLLTMADVQGASPLLARPLLRGYVAEFFDNCVVNLKKALAFEHDVLKEQDASVGEFGVQCKLLAKVAKANGVNLVNDLGEPIEGVKSGTDLDAEAGAVSHFDEEDDDADAEHDAPVDGDDEPHDDPAGDAQDPFDGNAESGSCDGDKPGDHTVMGDVGTDTSKPGAHEFKPAG